MSHPNYKHIGHPAIRLMEECAELIQAVAKAERFGRDSYHPDKPEVNNLTRVRMEFEDVMDAYNEYMKWPMR